LLALAACCALLLPGPLQAALSTASGAGVKFVAKGPGGISIVGQSTQLKVTDDGQLLVFVAPLSPLKSGIELRDKHMKEKYLEVEKYPNAELRIARGALLFPALGKAADAKVSGELKLHGRTKQESVQYTAKRDASGYSITGSMRINIKDFGIEVPSYLGVSVKPEVDITVQCHVTGS
jgi:hypothetical protein